MGSDSNWRKVLYILALACVGPQNMDDHLKDNLNIWKDIMRYLNLGLSGVNLNIYWNFLQFANAPFSYRFAYKLMLL